MPASRTCDSRSRRRWRMVSRSSRRNAPVSIALPGIRPWTVEYVAARALRDPVPYPLATWYCARPPAGSVREESAGELDLAAVSRVRGNAPLDRRGRQASSLPARREAGLLPGRLHSGGHRPGAAPSPLLLFAALGDPARAMADEQATEAIAAKTGPGIAVLLNVTFGNAELIIAFFALLEGLQVVKASIVGSIIGNILA